MRGRRLIAAIESPVRGARGAVEFCFTRAASPLDWTRAWRRVAQSLASHGPSAETRTPMPTAARSNVRYRPVRSCEVGDARLSPYDPEWPFRYATEAKRLSAALGDIVVAIEHAGSTSVPELAAKPTIDIALGVRVLTLPPEAYSMERLGYSYGGDHGLPQHVFRKGAAVPWEFLVHVVEHGGQMWCDFLRFRDHLRSHPVDADRYAELKAALLVGRGDWYSGRDKASFILPILDFGVPLDVSSILEQDADAFASVDAANRLREKRRNRDHRHFF